MRGPQAERDPGSPAGVAGEGRPRLSVARRLLGAPWLAPLLALGFAAVLLFAPLAESGIWDPYELDAADLARRIAIQVFGAEELAISGATSSMPTLTDLRMGELPFTSMALGFELFGLHDWSGRLPLALWSFAGAASLCVLLTRLVHPRAGALGVLALATMPLFFLQGRTMLGDAVTIAAASIAFSGLCLALFDARSGAVARGAFGALGALGLVAGYLCRGLLVGVAVPALGVGLGWALSRGALHGGERRGFRIADAAGALVLALGTGSALAGLAWLAGASPAEPLPRALGLALLGRPPVEGTFDLVVRQLGHALFPWSALLPLAFGRLLRAPAPAEASRREGETALRLSLLAGAAAGVAAHAVLAPVAVLPAFSATALLAAVCALALFDLDRGAPASRTFAVCALVFAFVLYRDLEKLPEKVLAAFVVDRPAFPKSFEEESARVLKASALVFGGLVALAFFERTPDAGEGSVGAWARRRAEEARGFFRSVAAVWNGNLLFFLVVVEAALVGLAGMLLLRGTLTSLPKSELPETVVLAGKHAFWLLPVGALGLALFGVGLRDGFRALCRAAGAPRSALAVLGAVLVGAVLALDYYPALAAQISPKNAFEAYARMAGEGEPLALVGLRSRVTPYYHRGEVRSLSGAAQAFQWLTAAPEPRRWVILKADELPKLNSLWRGARGENLPVLDGRSSQIVLASSRLDGRPNENPLGAIVLDAPPSPALRLDAAFGDELEVLGWEVLDEEGRVVPGVVPGDLYRIRFYYRVLRPVRGSWKAFIHIDRGSLRHNGDHAVALGKYPMNLWQPGDVVVDEHAFSLTPNFTPGDYTVFFGFFAGSTRFGVTRGEHHEDRVVAGTLRVR